MRKKADSALRILMIAFILLFCMFLSNYNYLHATPMQLQVQGTKLVSASSGCSVRLTGVDVDGIEWSPTGEGPPNGDGGDMTQSITVAVNTWNCNFVRIPLNQDYWFGYDTGGDNSSSTTQNTTLETNYRNYVANVVNTASALDCYVELDLHWSGNGSWGSSTNVKQQSMPDENSIAFWHSVAAIFANNPDVLFDLYNEPYPTTNTWYTWQNGGTSNEGFTCPGFQTLVQTVRDTGAKNVIIVGGVTWAKDLTGVPSHAMVDRNTGNTLNGYGIMYEEHNYDNINYPSGNDNASTWEQYIGAAVSAGYCVTIGEFGPSTGNTLINSGCNPWESNFLTWINGSNNENYAFNATAWCLHTSSAPSLITNWNFTPTSCHGTDIKNWLTGIAHSICQSPTNTPVVSPTPTYTVSPVLSPTPTYTITRTFTITPTYTNTPVPTATPTYNPPKGVVIYPNPVNYNSTQYITIKFYLSQPENVVWVKIYTFACRLIAQFYLTDYNLTKGWHEEKIDNYKFRQYINNPANGIYYYAIYDNKNGNLEQISQTDVFVLLR